MPLPLTKSQIERLGVRLVSEPNVREDDLAQLHDLLSAYGEVLSETTERVRGELHVAPTARVKNTGTIIEKLKRYGGSWLKSIQDIGGMRVIGEFDRDGQDALANQMVRLFNAEQRNPKVVDRRAQPVQGYRAVHVIVFPSGVPIEIQVRTERQHEWAELFEKLADAVGRGIRYGEPPAHWLSEEERAALPALGAKIYAASYELRVIVVDLAIAVAGLIALVEETEQHAPDNPELGRYRTQADEAIAHLRTAIDELRGAADQ